MPRHVENGDIIEITQPAVDKIAELIASRERGPQAVRVLLRGRLPGGGFQSEFKFISLDDRDEDDFIQDTGPFPLYFDSATAESLRGARVDFDEMKYAAGFNIHYPDQIADYPEAIHKEWDDPVAQAVQTVIERQINPAVAGHGGWVQLLDVRDETAYIEMGGGCQGCAISHMTLKQGIERMIMDAVPQITRVVDTTDHDEGQNPYYAYAPNSEEAAAGETPLAE